METETCALLVYISTFQFIQIDYHVLQYMVNNCNIEEVDSDGFTPLILASIAVPHADLVKVLRLLLNAGADAATVQKQGNNVLKRLLQRLSSCYLFPLPHRPEDIVDVIVRLIQSDAKLDLSDGNIWTPFDAALMPGSWIIWYQPSLTSEIYSNVGTPQRKSKPQILRKLTMLWGSHTNQGS